MSRSETSGQPVLSKSRVFALSCSVAGFATLASHAADVSGISFLDAHVHMNDRQELLRLMQEQNLDRAIVFWGANSDNETLADAAGRHPDRLIPFVSVSPERKHYRVFWRQNPQVLLTGLEKALKTGLYKGIGEISVVHFPSRGFPEADFDPMGEMMRGIMELAKRFNVPVTIHCEITRLRAFESLLQTFPDVRTIWAHGGYTPYFLAKRMIERYPNLTYELSARTYLRHPRSPDYTIFRNEHQVWPRWLQLIEDNPTRFIIGTDGAQRRISSDRKKIERVRLMLSQLSAETRELVARTNVLRLID